MVHGGFWLPQLDHNDLLLAVVAAWESLCCPSSTLYIFDVECNSKSTCGNGVVLCYVVREKKMSPIETVMNVEQDEHRGSSKPHLLILSRANCRGGQQRTLDNPKS